MITGEEVLALREAIPPRFPRGDSQNKRRLGPGRVFGAALRKFQREHGVSWFSWLKEHGNDSRGAV